MTYKRLITILLVMLVAVSVLRAQITVPNTFVSGNVIKSADVNTNFTTLGNAALNRSGGNITGNITLDPGITIDGLDIGATLCPTCTPTFGALTITGAATLTTVTATSVSIAGHLVGTHNTTAKSAIYTAVANDFVVANGTFTVTLPAASANTNAIIDIKNVGAGVITVGRTGSDTIDGATTQTLSVQYQSFTFISDGANWFIR